MLAQPKRWKGLALFLMLLGYVLAYGVNLRLRGFYRHYEFGLEHVVFLGVAVFMVWLIVSDVSRLEGPEEPVRGGWRRRYHHRSGQALSQDGQHDDAQPVDPPPSA